MLKSKGFKLSRTKAKYIECKISSTRQNNNESVIAGEEVTQMNKFRYLGSIIHNNSEIEEDLTNRI